MRRALSLAESPIGKDIARPVGIAMLVVAVLVVAHDLKLFGDFPYWGGRRDIPPAIALALFVYVNRTNLSAIGVRARPLPSLKFWLGATLGLAAIMALLIIGTIIVCRVLDYPIPTTPPPRGGFVWSAVIDSPIVEESIYRWIFVTAIVAVVPARWVAVSRAAIAGAAVKLSANATSLAKSANGSDDRAVRKKFAPRVIEISDDLSALARRVRKDIGLDAIAKDALDILTDATELVNLADEAEEKEERKSLRAQAQLLEQGVSAMHTNVAMIAAKTDKKPAAPASNKPAAMAADAYNQFVGAVKSASFDKGKLDTVAQGAASNYFTSAQVAGLMGLFSFDDGKIDAAVACWYKIVDPENNFVVFTKLQFDSSKDKLRKRVGK